MSLDLQLTESEEMLRKTALDFIQRDAPKEVIQALQETDTGCSEELWRKATDIGWLGVIIPEMYGGTENPLTTAGVLFETLGLGPLPGPFFSSGILGSLIILEAGTEEQKQRILPAVAAGEQILTLALTEPEYSWEPGAVQTTAESKNGDFVLNGVKLFTIDAQAATHFIVVARTGKKTVPGKGLSLFLVDSKSDGVSVRRMPGFFAGRNCEVKLDSVKVARSAMLGNKGEGWPALRQAINKSIPVLCAYKVGGCQAVLEMALEYSRIRVQFGQPVGRFQRVQDMIIEMFNHLEAARWTTYESLWKLDTQRPATESVHLAKVVSSEAYWQVCTLAHREFSGVGYAKDHPLSFHTRASRYLYNYLGDPSYHRQQIARLLTGC
ncbi:MAG: acyl-CoA/acyl-ACP dehydrogenase [Chloroflexi bacterium]|nr:acyl-CoA/acyl-ACP dehydrogenase [Chloroflexota bacterium]